MAQSKGLASIFRWISGCLWPVNPRKRTLPCSLAFSAYSRAPPRLEDPLGVVVVVDLVELPEVEVIGLEPAQAVLEVRLGVLGGAAAALGHEEDLVAPAPLRDRLAHPVLGLAVHVVPGIVEERDPFVDGPLDQTDGSFSSSGTAAWNPPSPIMVTFSPVRPSGRSGMPPALLSWAA